MNETVLYSQAETADSATLFIYDKSGRLTRHLLGEKTLIGRISDDVATDIALDCAIASRRHGEIVHLDGVYYYHDLDSLNGTFVDDVHYGKREAASVVPLKDGAVLRIDQKNLRHTHPEAVLMLFFTGKVSYSWKGIQLGETTGNIRIGRDPGASINLEDNALSRRHAIFKRGLKGMAVMDCHSTNGVRVNNRLIDQPRDLHRLDVIRIAHTTFLYLGDMMVYNVTESVKNQLQIHIEERSVRNNFKKKILLQDIRLTIDPGEMVMVLGGSGAGKTTFFNAVMGYEKAVGQIRQGDVDIYKDYEKMKYKIGYVPQQDLMRGEDIVYNTVENAARMKLPGNIKKEALAERIDETLEMLGLEKEKQSLVKKLSGGQRKRLSIAMELISDPSLFFLDEPDSGLDGVMAKSLMENLRVIADEGRIVLVITHAPDRVASLFDKVIVLAKSIKDGSGHMAFYGSISEAFAFFETDSLEGVVKRINRKDEGGDGLSDHYIEKYKSMQQ